MQRRGSALASVSPGKAATRSISLQPSSFKASALTFSRGGVSRYLKGVLTRDTDLSGEMIVNSIKKTQRRREADGQLPLQLLVVPLVGVAAGQDHGPGEPAGFDPRHEQLTELFGFCLRSKQKLPFRFEVPGNAFTPFKKSKHVGLCYRNTKQVWFYLNYWRSDLKNCQLQFCCGVHCWLEKVDRLIED